MVTRRTRAGAAPAADVSTNHLAKRIDLIYVDITDITPYEWNARDNAKAVESVAKSIQTFGFLVPCVIDQDNVLVAGHTRVEASKLLQLTEVPCVRADHLTEEQVRAFRLIDNKVAEIAGWDHELLASEMAVLDGVGFDMSGFGWSADEIDCLRSVVSADCLTADNLVSQQAAEEIRNTAPRRPQTARFTCGELVFFIPAEQYRRWSDGIRALCNYDEEAIAEELKQRLGILE